MKSILTEEQYNELAQFWHEYTLLGPRRDEIGLNRAGLALYFSEWIDIDEDEPCYGLSEIEAFFAEKERREGTAVTYGMVDSASEHEGS